MAGAPGELAARIVRALAGWLVILLVLNPGAALVGASAARLAAVVLMPSQQFFWTARRCMIDMPLTLAVLLACLAFHRALLNRSGDRRGRILWLAAGSLLTGAAILLMGAIGAGIPALALIGFFASRRVLRGLLRLAPAALLALAPVAAWIALLQMRLGASGVREFVWGNNGLRLAGGAAEGHTQPFYYYLPTLLAEMAPWSLLLPFAVAAAWRAARPGAGDDAAAGAADPRGTADWGGASRAGAAVRFPLVWLLLPLLVLSLSSTKPGVYLLPLHPAAAPLLRFRVGR